MIADVTLDAGFPAFNFELTHQEQILKVQSITKQQQNK
jgi:hypothetical protein